MGRGGGRAPALLPDGSQLGRVPSLAPALLSRRAVDKALPRGTIVKRRVQTGARVATAIVLGGAALVAAGSSPSQHAARREQALLLAEGLERLPEDYREVLILRHLEGLTFPEVAARMGRTVMSVKKLWARALPALRDSLGGSS